MKKNDWLEANRPDVWNSVIRETHGDLFDPDYLLQMGDVYRREFSGEIFEKDVVIPTIPLHVCRFPQAPELCEIKSGFDLPLLITPKHSWNGKLVVIASQDPLRKGNWCPDELSMCTPWGFSAYPNSSAGGQKIWPAVEWICEAGYGVYFTDVWKLYVNPKANVKKDPKTVALEQRVFSSEAAAISPVLWVAFGNDAHGALKKAGVSPIDKHPHPTAWGSLKRHYGTSSEKWPEIGAAMKGQIAARLGS